MKKTIVLYMFALTALLAAGTTAFGAPRKDQTRPAAPTETVSWTDSAGRVVELPANIERVAPSGPLAQLVLYTLCPDKIVGWSSDFNTVQKKYFPAPYWNKPVFGQFYGRGAALNREALIAARPDVIIDIGQVKGLIKDDMDSIQAQTGIPVVFVEANLDTMVQAYQALGVILNERDRAGELSRYVAETLQDAAAKSASIPENKRLRVFLGEGKAGQDANGAGTIHADVLDCIGAVNVAVMDKVSGGMTGASMENIILWNPDVILFGSGGAYDTVQGDPAWKALNAVKNKRYYEVPLEPYSWMGRPPSINRLLGIKWLGSLLYPGVYTYDMVAEAKRFFALFYHYELSDAEARALMARSTFKDQN